ncbi:hypothetical protein FB451DRAFT_688890 [Mycena latifolia]|nr:hypothetical protein FB451DRAFT_688890 [Mycena latifolia]
MKEMSFLSPLVCAFIFDGTLFFLLTFAIVLACAVIDLKIKGALETVGTPWLIATYSFSATRLILNIRKIAEKNMSDKLGLPTLEFSSSQTGTRDRAGHSDSYAAYFGE